MTVNTYRYWCILRPPMPGGIPRGPVNIKSFDKREFVKEINHTAWGYVDYERPLTDEEIFKYELATVDNIIF